MVTECTSFVQGKQLPLELEKALFVANTPKYELLDWVSIDSREKNLCVESAAFDIDFVAVVGPFESLFTDEDLVELTGNASGKICQLASTHIVRTKSFGRMLLYCKLGDWLVGEPLSREVMEDMEHQEFDGIDSLETTTSSQVFIF